MVDGEPGGAIERAKAVPRVPRSPEEVWEAIEQLHRNAMARQSVGIAAIYLAASAVIEVVLGIEERRKG